MTNEIDRRLTALQGGKSEAQAEIEEMQADFAADIKRQQEEYAPDRPQPPTKTEASVSRFLDSPPPEREFIVKGILPARIVAGFFSTGGLGKSMAMLQLSFALATGRRFGPFEPDRARKVLYVGAEDPEEELHRRIYAIAQQTSLCDPDKLSQNLFAISTFGQQGRLLEMDQGGNPIPGAGLTYLEGALDGLGVEVLFLDPMSRMFGLNENDNAHGTEWVKLLERLAKKYGLTVLFAHHIAKDQRGASAHDISGRGASSLRDGCRWVAGMTPMGSKEGGELGVDHREYVKFDIGKSNYSAGLPRELIFRRGENGVLEPADPRAAKLKKIAGILCRYIDSRDTPCSRSDLLKEEAGREVSALIQEEVKGFTQSKHMEPAINHAVFTLEWIRESRAEGTGRGRSKTILETTGRNHV